MHNIYPFLKTIFTGDLHSITLITEYCAKGALNDILENMDIKLDPMFISSLIHDLIKVCMTFVYFIRRKMILFDLIHRV